MDKLPGSPEHAGNCSTAAAQKLTELLSASKTNRDESWREQFCREIIHAALQPGMPPQITGPDRFTYQVLCTPGSDYGGERTCIRELVNDSFIQSGTGVVLNPGPHHADWVFSYGDLLNFKLRNEFYTKPTVVVQSGTVTLPPNEQLLVTQPSGDYLPHGARLVIRRYLQEAGIERPKCLLLTRREGNSVLQQIVFNIDINRMGGQLRLQHLGWFLPRHYILAAVPEEDELARHFADL